MMGYRAEYSFCLTGSTPLLMHADDIDWADELEIWRKDRNNRGQSKAGDDRSPAWTWQGYLYRDAEGKIAIPYEMVMAALKNAGAQIIWKKQKSFKEKTQSGLSARTEFFEFYYGPDNRQLTISDLPKREETYIQQKQHVEKDLGFLLFAKRAKVGQSKHVRIRPRFEQWSVRGQIIVTDADITPEILQQLFEVSGSVGLGDWRPSSKSPGPFGQFEVQLSK